MEHKSYKPNFWGEFKNSVAENEYQKSIAGDLNYHNRVASLVAGIGYWTVTFADYAKLGLSDGFYHSALLRLIYLIFCISVYLILRKYKSVSLTRNLSFLVTIGNSLLIISVIYFLNPDGEIDTIDQITVPVVTLIFYIFMYIPLLHLVINGMLVTVLYIFLISFILKSSADNIINLVVILGSINFMGFFLNRFLNISKRKDYSNKITIENLNESLMAEIEERKAIQYNLELALEQITDSIKYARKIQFALLPGKATLEKKFEDSALFFQPKNIVSGDFYWVNEVDNRTIVAVADCTGHGIPGAFMSVLGISLLNDIVKNAVDKKTCISSNEILNKLRESVILSLQQYDSNNDRRDGIDISLIMIDHKKEELEFSGAYNHLWLGRKNGKGVNLIEFKGDKMPIGIHSKKSVGPFTKRTYKYKSGDTIYLFSDGYKDQFGGINNKKFLGRRMRDMFIENYELDLPRQQQIWIDKFEQWKGNTQQVDDILIMALRL